MQNSHCFELKLDRTFAWLLRDLRGDPGNLPSIHGREQRGVIKLEHSWRGGWGGGVGGVDRHKQLRNYSERH